MTVKGGLGNNMETKNNYFLMGSISMIIINLIWIIIIYLLDIFIVDMYLIIPIISILLLIMTLIVFYRPRRVPDKTTIYEQLNKMDKNKILVAIQNFEQQKSGSQVLKEKQISKIYHIMLPILTIPIFILTFVTNFDIEIKAIFVSYALFMLTVVPIYKGMLLLMEKIHDYNKHLIRYYRHYLEEINKA